MEFPQGLEYFSWARRVVAMPRIRHDDDLSKGAMEKEDPAQQGNGSLRGQLGHRTGNEMIKESDSDFPEPGNNPEHSGERETEADPDSIRQTQESGERQKRNQGERREDPLAS